MRLCRCHLTLLFLNGYALFASSSPVNVSFALVLGTRNFLEISILSHYQGNDLLSFHPGIRAGVAYYLKGWGPKSYFQVTISPLIAYIWDQKDPKKGLLSQYGYPFGSHFTGFEYKWYIDTRKTSQRSGVVYLRIGSLFLFYENDGLAGVGKDRFRTGAGGIHLLIDSLYSISAEFISWTGETQMGSILHANGDYPFHAKHGWKDLSNTLYGGYSHGALRITFRSLSWKEPDAAIGVDSEWIRHIIQNKWIHDALPGKNPHYPPLDDQGYPYLKSPGQRIKPPSPVLEIGLIPYSLY